MITDLPAAYETICFRFSDQCNFGGRRWCRHEVSEGENACGYGRSACIRRGVLPADVAKLFCYKSRGEVGGCGFSKKNGDAASGPRRTARGTGS